MKILELKIKDVRGIKDEISFEPNGESMVIFGPNGTGKSAYKNLLKEAKKSARRWDNSGAVEKFDKIESQANEIIQRTQMEYWGINENVHYNKWADFSKADFLLIVEAFQDFESLFRCSKCGGIISLNMKGITKTNLKCSCGDISWNLEGKRE